MRGETCASRGSFRSRDTNQPVVSGRSTENVAESAMGAEEAACISPQIAAVSSGFHQLLV